MINPGTGSPNRLLRALAAWPSTPPPPPPPPAANVIVNGGLRGSAGFTKRVVDRREDPL